MEVSPKDNLTHGERKAVAGKLAGKTQAEIGKTAFPKATPGSARSQVSQALSRPRVQKALQTELEKAGITPKLRAERLREMYDAVKFEDEPDHKSRLEVDKHVSDLLGDKAPEKHLHANLSETLTEKLFADLDKGVIDGS